MSATVMIVEDDVMIREMMDITLSQAGYRVIAVGTGESSLDLLRRIKVDLVLLDIHMPQMSGLDVLMALPRIGRKVPAVLMVTANRQAQTVAEAMRLGCMGYMAKPFAPGDLLGRVIRALAGRLAPRTDFVEI
jgi:DNA-binding response OmpR family regulator